MKNRLPIWFRQEIPDENYLRMKYLLSRFGLHTVCQEAKCPNIASCFKKKEVTFMILGNVCTRNCRFCNVARSGDTSSNASRNGPRTDEETVLKIREVVKILGLDFVVITSVSRDDLADAGAEVFAQTIESIRKNNQNLAIEILIPDFQGNSASLKRVLDAGPDIVAHNIETVKRLYNDLRPQANYQISLDVLNKIKQLKPEITTKSSIMLGLGETEIEVIHTIRDLKAHQCDCLTFGQYLAPSPEHYPVQEFISLEQFKKYKEIAMIAGFKAVLSGPKVRSSYKAKDLYYEFSYT